MDFLQLAKERYSCRKFSDKPVEDEKISAILDAANAAPTATNAQPIHVWVIRTPENIEKVNKTTKCGFGASLMMIVGGKPGAAWVREDDGKNFAEIDAGIVGTHIMFAVQSLGLGTTWVGRIDAPKLKEFFPEMNGYEIVGMFPIGYPADDGAGLPSKKHFTRKDKNETVTMM